MSRRLGAGGTLLVCLLACRENPPPPPAGEAGVAARPGAPAAFSSALDSIPSVAQRPLTPRQLEGQEAYNAFCWTCHGLYGHGDGPGARGFPDALPDLGSAAATATLEELVGRLQPGRGGTGRLGGSVWHGLPQEQLRAALAYVTSFAQPGTPGNPAAGRLVYAIYCVHCHGVRGVGDGRLAQATARRPSDLRVLDLEGRISHVFGSVRAGGVSPHGRYMPNWGGALSDAQIWDVVAYLRVLQAAR